MPGGTIKLQKQFAYERGGKKYYKHIITIPNDEVNNLDWQEGEELQAEVRGRKLILKPKEDK